MKNINYNDRLISYLYLGCRKKLQPHKILQLVCKRSSRANISKGGKKLTAVQIRSSADLLHMKRVSDFVAYLQRISCLFLSRLTVMNVLL